MSGFLITFPHSGEVIHEKADWLKSHSKEILLTDVDRFVDELYAPVVSQFSIPFVKAPFHRYHGDLNRLPNDVDCDSVKDSPHRSGSFSHGFYWVKTTKGVRLMLKPLSLAEHAVFVSEIYEVFHVEIQKKIQALKTGGASEIFHLDCHSMPSQGEASHKDKGEVRKDVVLSDFNGKSCAKFFLEKVKTAFESEGFSVGVNWPYQGGRITQMYGKPQEKHHTLQIELNRKLYMNEITREKLPEFKELQARLLGVFEKVFG